MFNNKKKKRNKRTRYIGNITRLIMAIRSSLQQKVDIEVVQIFGCQLNVKNGPNCTFWGKKKHRIRKKDARKSRPRGWSSLRQRRNVKLYPVGRPSTDRDQNWLRNWTKRNGGLNKSWARKGPNSCATVEQIRTAQDWGKYVYSLCFCESSS